MQEVGCVVVVGVWWDVIVYLLVLSRLCCTSGIVSGRSKFLAEWVSLRNTPAADMIECEWLGIFYIMDLFHVVYKFIFFSTTHLVR